MRLSEERAVMLPAPTLKAQPPLPQNPSRLGTSTPRRDGRPQSAIHLRGRSVAAARRRESPGRLKEYCNRTVLGPKLLVLDETG